MAQTARLALFGPFFIFVDLCWPLLAAVENKNKNLYTKKTHTYGPNDTSGIVWALFRLRGPALAFVGWYGPSWAFVGIVQARDVAQALVVIKK